MSSRMAEAYERQFEAWQEQQREWRELCQVLEHQGYILVNFALDHTPQVNDWLFARYGPEEAYCFCGQAMVKTTRDALWIQLNWCK
jgi:hypothetical protein